MFVGLVNVCYFISFHFHFWATVFDNLQILTVGPTLTISPPATFDTALKQALGDGAALSRVQAGEVAALEVEAWPVVAQLLYATADLRQSVRLMAKQSKGLIKGSLLTICDRLRDEYLPIHGIRLQDRTDFTIDQPDLPAIGLFEKKLLISEKHEEIEV